MTTLTVPTRDAGVMAWALWYAQALGWSVFPVEGKRPARFVRSWPQESTTDPATIAAWYAGTSGLGVAVDMAKSGLVAVDGDHLEAMGSDLWEALEASPGWRHQGNPERLTNLYRMNGHPIPQARHEWGEVKAGGGYIVLAPSPHPDGWTYTWTTWTPEDLPTFPEALEPLVAPRSAQEGPGAPWSGGEASEEAREHCEALRADLARSLAAMPEGNRNHTLNDYALRLGHYVPHILGEEATRGYLVDAARAAGLKDDEILPTIRSGMRRGMAEPQEPEVLRAFHPALPEVDARTDFQERVGMVDWGALWAAEEPERETLIPGLWTCGALGTLFSGPGVGKSLLALEWAACLATGQDILGLTVEPRTVLYVDHENDRALLRERLEAMGFSASDDLGRLHYSLLGDWHPLDTEVGGQQLAWWAEEVQADLVVIDTTARVIAGEENTADTFHNLYRHTLRPLKAAGRAVMRLDHTGKDESKGERGSSAKRGDVDLSYALSLTGPDTVALHRVKNRLHLEGDDTVMLQRQASPLRHVPVSFDHAREVRIAAMVTLLDRLGLPDSASRPDADKALEAGGYRLGRTEDRAQAILRRKLR